MRKRDDSTRLILNNLQTARAHAAACRHAADVWRRLVGESLHPACHADAIALCNELGAVLATWAEYDTAARALADRIDKREGRR